MMSAFEQFGVLQSFEAGADLSAAQYRFVTIDSSGKAVLANATSVVIGVLQNDPKQGQMATVFIGNGLTPVRAGGTLTIGQKVTGDANGQAVAATTGQQGLGIVVKGASAGELATILFFRFPAAA
jgi:hypothetical protein